ncbi:MAG: hypothetical protein HYW25_00410 [Candidatus Aenigmarchaeota archaeon]|nr:hypothetical protein [Candidatus Aenigmarchaeota archaeon]
MVGVTGELSRFNEGFFAYKQGGAKGVDFQRMLVQKPPIEKGRILASSGCTSCIDLPDGLIKALNDTAGDYGFVIDDSEIPVNMGDYKASGMKIRYRHEMASYPAGDIELLFTIPEKRRGSLEEKFGYAGLKIYWIGKVVSKPGIHIDSGGGKLLEPGVAGFVHRFKGKMLFDR